MAAARPYYDMVLSRETARSTLSQMRARESGRVGSAIVYDVQGGGQARVTPASSGVRVEIFVGKCPC